MKPFLFVSSVHETLFIRAFAGSRASRDQRRFASAESSIAGAMRPRLCRPRINSLQGYGAHAVGKGPRALPANASSAIFSLFCCFFSCFFCSRSSPELRILFFPALYPLHVFSSVSFTSSSYSYSIPSSRKFFFLPCFNPFSCLSLLTFHSLSLLIFFFNSFWSSLAFGGLLLFLFLFLLLHCPKSSASHPSSGLPLFLSLPLIPSFQRTRSLLSFSPCLSFLVIVSYRLSKNITFDVPSIRPELKASLECDSTVIGHSALVKTLPLNLIPTFL